MSQQKGGYFMAGSSSMTPKPVSPSRSVKHFSIDEANRTLPLVKRIVGDIVKTHQRIGELEAALISASPKTAPIAQAEMDHVMERFQNYVEELSKIGCQMKDPKMGLIDFLGSHQGRDICLCWKLGEDRIEHWHETTAGYTGRQPVAMLV
jgi:hypothetical protein